jgi:DNA-binding transcriptional regulator YhcF (GntR family)
MAVPRKWRDVLPIHPAADLFPLMSPDELKALGEDIRKNGLKERVKVLSTWSKPLNGFDPALELTNVLIDGRNRLDAMEAAGINLFRTDGQFENSFFLSLSGKVIDPYAYVISANIHRRHLTTAQRIELVEKVIKLNPEMSSRRAAKLAGVSPTTATKAKEKLEQTGDVSTVDTSIDTKGRRQPVHKTAAKKARRAEREAEPKDLQELVNDLADQIQEVAESLEPQARAVFFVALRQELSAVEDCVLAAPEADESAEASE